eukprot:PhF_6_TR4534/c0_g1_i7/m.6377
MKIQCSLACVICCIVCHHALTAAAMTANPQCTISGTPYGTIDFSTVPTTTCPGMQQIYNGVPSGTYDFTFSWCRTAASSSCQASYMVQGGNNVCDRAFTGWSEGMEFNNQVHGVKYVVNDGAGTTAEIDISCDPAGEADKVMCPSKYAVTGDGPFVYSIVLKAKAACGTLPPPTMAPIPTTSPPVVCAPYTNVTFATLPSLACSNVQHIANGILKKRVYLALSWCTATSPPGTSTCRIPGYAVMEDGNRTMCHRVFDQWSGGINYDPSSQTAAYAVIGGVEKMIVIIECDPNGALNNATCPESILSSGSSESGQTYTVVVKSRNACPAPSTPTPTPIRPVCPSTNTVPWITTPITCPNVPHFKDGSYASMSSLVLNWCQQRTSSNVCVNQPPSYALMTENGQCTLPYDTWVNGVQTSDHAFAYTIRNAYSPTTVNMSVSVVCDRSGPQGTVQCPESIVTMGGHTDVVLRSPNACPAPNCNPTRRINFQGFQPMTCANVAVFTNGIPSGIYSLLVNWCQPLSPSPTAAPVTTTAAPVTSTAAPMTTTAAPVTSTAAPVTTTAAPVTTTAAPVTTTAAPVT